MKKLLLTSALVAVSGAALAEVTVGGSAEIGYNDRVEGLVGSGDFVQNEDTERTGIFADVSIDLAGTQELDNGLSFTVDYGGDIAFNGDDEATTIEWDEFPDLTFESSAGTLSLGDFDHAAHDMFNDVAGMDAEFTEVDDEMVLRADTALMGQAVGFSYTANDRFEGTPGLPAESFTIAFEGAYNGFDYSLAYENNEGLDGDSSDDDREVFGIGGGYEWNNIVIGVAYADAEAQGVEGTDANADIQSYGLRVGYNFGEIEVEASVASNEIENATTDLGYDSYLGYGVEANLNAMGADFTFGYEDENDEADDGSSEGFYGDVEYTIEQYGLTLYAGYDETEENILVGEDNFGELGSGYVGAKYALGGGASLWASYAEADEIDPDENIHAGLSLAVALDF